MTEVIATLSLVTYAFGSSILMSIAFGYMGSYIVLRKQGFLADTIAHSSLLGVAIGFFLGVAPQAVLIPFSVIIGLVLTWITLNPKHDPVGVSAVLFSSCAGLGALILGLKGIGGQEFVHVLFGDVLWISKFDFLLFFFVSILVLGFVAYHWKKLTLIMLNRDVAIASGIRPEFYEYCFAVCVALLIGVSIKLVGVFLVTSLIAVPPLIASRFVKSFHGQLVVSTAASVVLTMFGFLVALRWDLPLGPAISAFLGIIAVFCGFLTKVALKT